MAKVRLFADAYEHLPQPEVIIEKRPIMDEDGTKSVGTRSIWRINGTLIEDGPTAIQVKVDALEAAYAAPAKLELKDESDVVIYSLDGAASRDGLVVTMPPSYPIGSGFGQYATQRRYSIVVEASIYVGGEKGDPEILWLSETTSYSYDQHGKITRMVSGSLRTKEGVSAGGKFGVVTPSIPSGYNRIGYNKSTNDDDDELGYSFTDVEYWEAWPTATTGGEVTQTSRLDDNGMLRIGRGGRFQGSGAQAAADSYKLGAPQYRPITETQATNPFDGSVSFTYEYFDTVNSETAFVSYQETVNLQYGLQDFVVRPVLGGGDPVRQDTVVRPFSGSQSGSAVGHSAFPSYPAAVWSTYYMKTKQESKSGPRRNPGGTYTDYGISWSYGYEFAVDPSFPDPNKP